MIVWFHTVCPCDHDHRILSVGEKQKLSNWDRQSKGRTEITMFRCEEVKWTRERENRAKDSILHWHQAPNLAALQPNLVKIFPCLMPSWERKKRRRRGWTRDRSSGRRRAKGGRGKQWEYLRWGLMKVSGVSEGGGVEASGRGGRGIMGTLSSKGLPRAGS